MRPQTQNHVKVTLALNPESYTGDVRRVHVARLRFEDKVPGHPELRIPAPQLLNPSP